MNPEEKQRKPLILSERDFQGVEEELQRPPQLGEALLEAADRYAEAVRTGKLISRPDK